MSVSGGQDPLSPMQDRASGPLSGEYTLWRFIAAATAAATVALAGVGGGVGRDLEGRVASLDERIEARSERLSRIEASLEETSTALTGLEERLVEIERRRPSRVSR